MKNPWVIIGVITVGLFGGAVWYSSVAAERNNEGVQVPEVHVKGNPDATVVLEEFSDLQCPACASFQPVLNEVLTEYGDVLRLEYKHFPLPTHQHAIDAALAAEAAGQQGKFFEYHDLLFANQQTWAQAAAPTALFVQYAEELSLDVPTFRRHMNSSLLREKVLADRSEAQQRGVNATPTFFLNGQRMQIQTFEDFVTQIAVAVGDDSVVGTSTAPTAPNTEASTPSEPSVRFGI